MTTATRLSPQDLAAALMAERGLLEERNKMRRYADDPVGFIRDVLGEHAWSKQAEIAMSVRDNRFTAVPSCHSSGKSWLASRLILWWVSIHAVGEAIVVTSAPTDNQVRSVIWRETKGAHVRAGLPGTMTQSEWRIGGQLVAQGRKPSDYSEAAFQGMHAKKALVLLDEGSGIHLKLWEQAETLVANEGCRMLVIGNPDDPTGVFAKACRADSIYKTIRISAFDTPAFTGEAVSEDVLDQLISPVWVQERAESWGEDSNLYRAKVLGHFPDQRSDSVFPLSLIERARELELPDEGWAKLGVDVARYGPSESVIYRNRGGVVRLVAANRGEDTSRTMGRIIRAMADEGASYAMVDEIGVGAGVVDVLQKREGRAVYGINGANKSHQPDRFANLRAEAYWMARELMQKGAVDLDPADEVLAEQLSLIRYRINGNGTRQIESKEDMRRQGRSSPDRADAFVLSLMSVLIRTVDRDAEERAFRRWRRRNSIDGLFWDDDNWGPDYKISDY